MKIKPIIGFLYLFGGGILIGYAVTEIGGRYWLMMAVGIVLVGGVLFEKLLNTINKVDNHVPPTTDSYP